MRWLSKPAAAESLLCNYLQRRQNVPKKCKKKIMCWSLLWNAAMSFNFVPWTVLFFWDQTLLEVKEPKFVSEASEPQNAPSRSTTNLHPMSGHRNRQSIWRVFYFDWFQFISILRSANHEVLNCRHSVSQLSPGYDKKVSQAVQRLSIPAVAVPTRFSFLALFKTSIHYTLL